MNTDAGTHSSALESNPFNILGATTRDSRYRIVELAAERNLQIDADICAKAQRELTTPRNRLAVEMAWMPGLSPKRAMALVDALRSHIDVLKSEASLPALANANLLAAAFERLDPDLNSRAWCDWIVELAVTVDRIVPEDVLREVNEDRSISGFPEVRDLALVDGLLAERRRYFTDVIKNALDRLALMKLVEVVTAVVRQATASGQDHAPQLIHELVDRYETEANRYLQPEAENLKKLVSAIRESAPKGESAAIPLVERLIQLSLKWDAIARPIQLSMKTRGLEHELSHTVAWGVRSLAIDLFNKHDMLDVSTRLNKHLKTLFAEVPEVAEKLDEDAEALDDISRNREEGKLLDPMRALCERAVKNAEHNPMLAADEGLRILREGTLLIDQIPVKVASRVAPQARNILAVATMNCAIEHANKTAKWDTCAALLESALRLASDSNVRQRVQTNLETARRNAHNLAGLEPVSSAPTLWTINGVGVTLYGNSDHDRATGSYMATYYFTVLFVPIFPIARYRVIQTAGGYRFLGKGPLRTFDVCHIVVSIGIILAMFAH